MPAHEGTEEKNQELARTPYNSFNVSIAGWKPVLKGKIDTARKCCALPFFGFDNVILNTSPSRALQALVAAQLHMIITERLKK